MSLSGALPAPGRQRRPPDRPARAALTVVPDAGPGPAGVLGVAWAVALVAAVEAGPLPVAVLGAAVAVVASVSSERAWPPAGRRRRRRRVSPIPVLAAVAIPVTALAGTAAAVVTVIAAAVVLAFGAALFPAGVHPARRVAVGLAPAVAAAALVLATRQGVDTALVLVVAVCLYDLAAFVVGRGPTGGAAGIGAGMLSVGVLAVFVSAVLVPPFSGVSPWVTVGLVGVAAPAGVLALQRRVPAHLPALRRIDSLALGGPAWVAAVAVLLHR